MITGQSTFRHLIYHKCLIEKRREAASWKGGNKSDFMAGWTKLHRDLLNKSIWQLSTPEQKTVLVTLLLMANHEERNWEWNGEKYCCKPGQFITSLEKIVENCGKGITIQNVRTALKRFEKLEFLTNESTKHGRLITIVNWGFYQSDGNKTNKEANKELTDSQQTANKELTPNKNEKNDKNEKNINTMCNTEALELFEKLWKLFPNKKGKGQVSLTAKRRLLKVGLEEMTRAIDRYISELEKDSEWRRPQNGSTFFNSGYIDYLDDNYVPQKEVKTGTGAKKNSFNNIPKHDYDFDELEKQLLQRR